MHFDKIIYGTQYYRSPTPLPEEWDGDIAKMADFELDAFQIRINWRWNERRENEYDFTDVDRLMELAEKHGRKVIIKFLLECAPQYVFDKYGGTRIGPRGEQLRGGSHGAFYGGWRPCFTNPKVRERAVLFVEKVAQRYAGRKNLILWNAWNEIRNRPIEDCFCPHCRKAFGKYLKDKFGTVEALNAFYGTAEDSFETIALPAMAHGYWDIYEFKLFKGSYEMYDWLRFVRDAIRKYDTACPVMSHVGACAGFQVTIDDVCDDYTAAKAVDFFGSSLPLDCSMDTQEKRLDFQMLTAYMQSVDKNYFMHEIYPGLGMFRKKWYDTPFDMRFKLYSTLSGGAKGMVFWQYRAERLGNENDCAGIMRMDGSPRPVAGEVRKFGENLHRDMAYFAKASVKPAEIGIVFDFNSMLMSEIEDACGRDFEFVSYSNKYYYRYAHAGVFRLARKLDYGVDYVQAREPGAFKNYKVLYVPYGAMINEPAVEALAAFVRNGGTLLLDEGFAMRQMNTWMNPYELNCKSLATIRMQERRETDEYAEYKSRSVQLLPYKSEYAVANAESIMAFRDGKPAVHKLPLGEGTVYLFGFSLGYGYYQTDSDVYEEIFRDVTAGANLTKQPYSDFKKGIYSTVLETEDKEEILFLFNVSGEKKAFPADGMVQACGGDFTVEGDCYCLENNEMGYLVKKRRDL